MVTTYLARTNKNIEKTMNDINEILLIESLKDGINKINEFIDKFLEKNIEVSFSILLKNNHIKLEISKKVIY